MNKFKSIIVRSRKSIMITNLFLTFGIAIIELFIYLVLGKMENISMKANLLVSFVLPTSINLIICLIGYLLLRNTRVSENAKNYIPIYVLSFLCFTLASIHSAFQATLSSFCIPVIITIIYVNKRMTRIIFISCLLLQQIAVYISSMHIHKQYGYVIIDVIVSSFILLTAYACSIVVIRFEQQKKEIYSESIVRQSELQEQLLIDTLTSLNNLRAFRGALEEYVEEAEFSGKDLVLAVIDIDDFKKINDVYGHEQGNVVLAKLGRLLRKFSGEEGIAARYGGEEFAVLFHDIDVKEAVRRMQKVLTKFSEVGFPGLDGKKVTFSCGIVEYMAGITPQEFFTRADKAMYSAKRDGKNNVLFERRNGF